MEGNQQKMREALMKCEELFSHPCNSHEDEVDCTVLLLEAKRKVRLALSAPPRNCDVGTADEQEERFHNFCKGETFKHEHERCLACPAYRKRTNYCKLFWAQMPYGAERKGEKDDCARA